jgi:ATPase subunit of ABC transporter with duplicated ATPase domains
MSNKKDINHKTIFANKIDVKINGKNLINDSDIVINDKTKYFIIGKNGVGKSTLLKVLYNKLLEGGNDVLMIEQDIKLENDEQTVLDFILNANIELYQKKKEMLALEELEELSEEQNNYYNELSMYVYSNEYDKYEANAFKILNGLCFNDVNLKVKLLSGGWRVRLALGKALLYKPSVLLLDETNNHLDINATIWLTDYLESYNKTLIFITHQINFINSLAEYIWYIGNPEMKGTHVYTIRGNYNNYLQTIEQMTKEMQTNYDKYQKKLIEMKKQFGKTENYKKDLEKFIAKHEVFRPNKPYKVIMNFEDVNVFTSRNIIEIRNVSFGYDKENIILENIDFSIDLNSRIIIVGDNGVGKTTIFKLCKELVLPIDGTIIKDQRVKIGYFNQHVIDSLPLELTPIEYLMNINSKLTESDCRNRLGKIGIKKELPFDPCKEQIKNLSGGQKCRVAMCVIQIDESNIIMFDEPTNNLDIESINALIEGINAYNGGIIIISHDIYLIKSIQNASIYEIKNKKFKLFGYDFDEYVNKVLNK